jgi:hypothetical protein
VLRVAWRAFVRNNVLGCRASFRNVDATWIPLLCGWRDAGVARARQYICVGARRGWGVPANSIAVHTVRPVLQPTRGIAAETRALSDGSHAELHSPKPVQLGGMLDGARSRFGTT